MNINGAATVAGIIGWPISHSLSPVLHGHWIAEYGLNAAYVPFPCSKDGFSDAIKGLAAAGVRGLNVTVPHKQSALALATRADEAARIAGAANLLVFGHGEIEAFNTDQSGLIAALDEALGKDALVGSDCVVLGAGGMARAGICALSRMGVRHVTVLARNPNSGQALIESLGSLRATLSCAGFGAWEMTAKSAALIVNATSAGMKGFPPLDLDLSVVAKSAAVFDAVYNPLETDLLARAKRNGLCAIDGLGMLMHQAVPSFATFFGHQPKVTPALRKILESALDG